MAAALVLATGCSAIVVRGPRTVPTGEVVCPTPSYVPPVIDAAIALAGVALIVWSATAPDGGEGADHAVSGRDFADYPGMAMAIPFGFSSAYGFTKVASCRSAARASVTATSDDPAPGLAAR